MVQKWSQQKVDHECTHLINNVGYLPGGHTLKKWGLNALFMAIKRHGGGMNATRSRLGLDKITMDFNYESRKNRSDKEVIKSSKILYGDLGHFPSVGWMQGNGYAWLNNQIARRFGGTRKFQEMMGFEKTNMHKSSNGRLWDSKAEASLSNFFSDVGIIHERGHSYPDETRRTFDFYLPNYDLHLELWGDYSQGIMIPIKENYESRRRAKEQFHAESDLNILCIEYKDAINNNRLKEIFAEYL